MTGVAGSGAPTSCAIVSPITVVDSGHADTLPALPETCVAGPPTASGIPILPLPPLPLCPKLVPAGTSDTSLPLSLETAADLSGSGVLGVVLAMGYAPFGSGSSASRSISVTSMFSAPPGIDAYTSTLTMSP